MNCYWNFVKLNSMIASLKINSAHCYYSMVSQTKIQGFSARAENGKRLLTFVQQKGYLLVLLLLLTPVGVNAQEGTTFENDLNNNPIPYYSYKKGLGLTSPDSIYQMNFRFRMQNRVTIGQNNADETFVDGQIRRLRIRYDGYVGNPKFSYMLQLSFTPGDLGGAVQDGTNLKIVRDAVFFYRPNDHWNFGFGQTKLPGNRQRLNSSGALQLTDRSINNANFTIDRDFGAQIHWLNERKDRFSYNVKSAISMGEGRAATNNKDANLAYTGKVELYPLGTFTRGGDYFEGDLMREESPRIMVSGAYSLNNNAKQSKGQLGQELYSKRDLHNIFADFILKYKGFAFMSSYMQRKVNDPVTFNPDSLSQISYAYAGYGVDFQASYLFKSNIEIIGRYSTQQVDTEIRKYAPNLQQMTLGATKYFWEHAFKLQCEVTYNLEDYVLGLQKDNWYFRFQVEIGI